MTMIDRLSRLVENARSRTGQAVAGVDRGRLTIPDVFFVLMSIAFLAAVYPIFIDLFEQNQHYIPTGAGILWQMILPMALLVLFTVIYVKSLRGLHT